jgi:hypothetical protein
MIELKVGFFASSVWIESEIWNNNLNKFSLCDMVFDTGASMTAIDTGLALRSGYSLKNAETVQVYAVGSTITAKRIVIPNFRLGGVILGPILVDVVDFSEESNTSALLGMNVIREFKVVADFKDKRPKPDGRDATIYLEPTFQIHEKASLESFMPASSRFGLW